MAYFEIWKDEREEFRLTLKGDNHEIIFTTEGYTRKENAEKAASLAVDTSKDTPIYDRTV